ncbi:hypothetical protein SRABI76_00370 [Microbacterium oxydans]|uniref:Uncharacterized protein n=1 Tax=Microbacterium oxydans TaxID=82380 RepID=A0A0F0L887_9MICO|nr:hypothetical protein [Microbacterium oxydans]KJL28515.1 hypothetical protein RS83_03589 [Microbacterium oxydans]CAH0133910.1 hypothetical protein SRABI76_00370 [Microbacterium oxydans]
MSDETLESIAAELYSGPPAEFIAARDAKAKDAGAALSAQVKALRKPSIAAWVVNVFAHERADQLSEALQLAEELREAQEDLDAQTLAKLGRERRALTRRLAQGAAELAKARGERVTPATLDAVQQTLSAAFFDPDAAAAVASGRLIRELESSGGVDLGTVVAGAMPDAPSPSPAPADEVGARRRRRDAERALREAEKARDQAERAHTKADTTRKDADRRSEDLHARIAELEAELAKTRTDAERAEVDLQTAEEREAATADDLTAASNAVAEAQEALDQLD